MPYNLVLLPMEAYFVSSIAHKFIFFSAHESTNIFARKKLYRTQSLPDEGNLYLLSHSKDLFRPERCGSGSERRENLDPDPSRKMLEIFLLYYNYGQ